MQSCKIRGLLEKFQHSSNLPDIKYNCVVLFLRQKFWFLICAAEYIFSHTTITSVRIENKKQSKTVNGGTALFTDSFVFFFHFITKT